MYVGILLQPFRKSKQLIEFAIIETLIHLRLDLLAKTKVTIHNIVFFSTAVNHFYLILTDLQPMLPATSIGRNAILLRSQH
ncbi:hypothetical protein ACJX0J_018467, partial [Zea mays]